jgi:phosphoenolpyruvate synthase/pyruvate phosphate dikinase
VFVRSSTNAEDLAAFSGAGLYDTLPNVKGTDAVVAAIAQVWASLWNFAAYENRQRYGIDHARAYAAVLVQLGVDGTAAGVLVTAHPTDPTDDRNYTINAKTGLGLRVVDGKKVPESLLVSWYNHGIRVLSRSAEDTKLVFDETGGIHEVANPDAGKPVLTNRMAIRLADTAKQLTRVFRRNKLDIEWVFAGDTLDIVQIRPYVTD